jgi:hypothetical protein
MKYVSTDILSKMFIRASKDEESFRDAASRNINRTRQMLPSTTQNLESRSRNVELEEESAARLMKWRIHICRQSLQLSRKIASTRRKVEIFRASPPLAHSLLSDADFDFFDQAEIPKKS